MASSSAIPTHSSFSISFRGQRHGHLLLQAPHHPGPPHRHRHRHRPLPPPLPPQRAGRTRPPRPPLPTNFLLRSFHHLRRLRASCHRSPPTLPKPASIPQHHNHHHPLRRHFSSPRSHQQDQVLEQREGTDRFLSRYLDRRGRIQEIFEDLRKCEELAGNQVAASLDDKDLVYFEAACMLHSIGLFTSKNDYHKQSYSIIMVYASFLNGDHLRGYSTEEIKLRALFVRHHRKEFPKVVKKKLKFLCAIIRVSVALWEHQCMNKPDTQSSCSYEVFKFQNGI